MSVLLSFFLEQTDGEHTRQRCVVSSFSKGLLIDFCPLDCSILWFPYLNIFCLSTCHWNQSLNYISLHHFHIWILLLVRLIWHVQFCLSDRSEPDDCRCSIFLFSGFVWNQWLLCAVNIYITCFFYCYFLCFEYFLLIFFNFFIFIL